MTNHLSTANLELAWALYATRILTGGPFEDEKKRRARNHLRTAEEALRAWMRENEVAEWEGLAVGARPTADGFYKAVTAPGHSHELWIPVKTAIAHIERALEMLPQVPWAYFDGEFGTAAECETVANTLLVELRAARESLQ